MVYVDVKILMVMGELVIYITKSGVKILVLVVMVVSKFDVER